MTPIHSCQPSRNMWETPKYHSIFHKDYSPNLEVNINNVLEPLVLDFSSGGPSNCLVIKNLTRKTTKDDLQTLFPEASDIKKKMGYKRG